MKKCEKAVETVWDRMANELAEPITETKSVYVVLNGFGGIEAVFTEYSRAIEFIKWLGNHGSSPASSFDEFDIVEYPLDVKFETEQMLDHKFTYNTQSGVLTHDTERYSHFRKPRYILHVNGNSYELSPKGLLVRKFIKNGDLDLMLGFARTLIRELADCDND